VLIICAPKAARHRKTRMDARTRERLPVLPVLIRTVDQRRKNAAELLQAARHARSGETFTAASQTLTRPAVTRQGTGKVWAGDPSTGKRRDLTEEEDLAFWAWATVEVLRLSGVRVEELLELDHHSLVRYRLPTTVFWWQPISAAIAGTPSPSQLSAMIRARSIQSAGACRPPANLRIFLASPSSCGARALKYFGTGLASRQSADPPVPLFNRSKRNVALVTTITDLAAASAQELARAHCQRWEEECSSIWALTDLGNPNHPRSGALFYVDASVSH
jgi:hypothetical protein